MIYETIFDGKQIPKIGFGTWSIGGHSRAEPRLDSVSLAALRSTLQLGYTHFDTAEGYAAGHAEELIGQAIRETGAQRDSLCITTKVAPEHLEYEQILKACKSSLQRLNMDHIDLYLIHWPRTGMKFEETFRALNQLVRDGQVRYLGVSNFSVKLLKQSQEHSKTPIITNQVPYSIYDRSYVRNGVLEYCQQNDILLTAYSPLEQGRLKANTTLRSIAETHSATPYQIALTWLISQLGVITIPMSLNPRHIKENFESVNIVLTEKRNQITQRTGMTLPTRTIPKIEIIEEQKEETELEPLYRVIIHNDDVTPMDFVVHALTVFFYLSNPKAAEIMMTAHFSGMAYVQTLPKSEAEKRINKAHFAAGLEGYPLHFSMEAE